MLGFLIKILKSNQLNFIMFDIDIQTTFIKDVYRIKNSVFNDDRGSLWTFVDNQAIKSLVGDIKFNHVKFAKNKKNVLRGIHGDFKSWKLVSCVYGKVQQVIVDNRQESITYQSHISEIISDESFISFLLPPGVGNAFKSIESSVYVYSLAYPGNYVDADKQFSLKWNDPDLKINWIGNSQILSKRDK